VLGIVHHVPGAGLFGESPFELDRALKTVSLGWFESRRTLPVTLVDIDAATHCGVAFTDHHTACRSRANDRRR
jgi:hypothetical protein